MKQLSLLLINTLLASQAFSQDNSEQVRKINELLAESNSLASELYNEGNFSQSKQMRLKVIDYADRLNALNAQVDQYIYCAQWNHIAHCELKLKNLSLAVEAYRKSMYWVPNYTIAPFIGFNSTLSEYSIALARSNNLIGAKALYYASLTRLKTNRWSEEPTPFLVVFDPDPKAEVWKLNKENLIKAAMCINAMENGFYREEFFEKYSDWDYAIQMKNAKFPGEKFNQENDPNIMRKNLQVLINAEKELKTELPKICEKYIDPHQNP